MTDEVGRGKRNNIVLHPRDREVVRCGECRANATEAGRCRHRGGTAACRAAELGPAASWLGH